MNRQGCGFSRVNSLESHVMLCGLRMRLSTALCLVGLVSSSAQAELIVNIGSTVIQQGGTGSIDVLIQATSAADNLGGFSARFAVSTVDGRQLWFATPVVDSQLGDPNYVFAGTGSAAIDNPPAGSVDPDQLGYVGTDFSNDPGGVTGPFSSLLARLDFTALTDFLPQVGDIYTVSLVTGGDTAFFDPDFGELGVSSTSGAVTIGAAQAVPEPSSMLLMAAGLGGAAFMKRRRARTHAERSPKTTEVTVSG